MIKTIRNDRLALSVDTWGAQMMELKSVQGIQYLWNGDEKYWSDRAPVLFPFVGRLKDSRHAVDGKNYPMKIHGFASACEFLTEYQDERNVTLLLSDNECTMAQYPFSFDFRVSYSLVDWTVEITYQVTNRGEDELSFGLGGHPGFRVPFAAGTAFEDYSLRFSKPCWPDRVGFSESLLLNGMDLPYPLEDGQILPLRHGMFDNDAIIMKNTMREVSIVSGKTSSTVTVSFPQMPYVGFWHKPKTQAPYVCIEPWLSLPGRQGITEEFASRSDLIHLPPGKKYENQWYITIKEG